MNDYTRALHQRFWQEPEGTEEEREMDRAEQALKATLDREQRKLLLALINAQSLWQERTCLESFAAGLRLGLVLAGEPGSYSFEAELEARAERPANKSQVEISDLGERQKDNTKSSR